MTAVVPGATNVPAASLTSDMIVPLATTGPQAAQTTLGAIAQFVGTDVPVTTGITAHAGGGQTLATALAQGLNNVTTVATAGDSVKLPASTVGDRIIVVNSAANAMQVFGSGTDTINGVATATGISQGGKMIYVYYCAVAGNWLTQAQWIITSASATALAVGLNGATNPALLVDASTASSATGVEIKSAAAASGVAVSTLSSGTDENITIDAKGTGTLTLQGTATGNIVAGRTISGSNVVMTSNYDARTATATPAAASAVAAFTMGSATIGIYWGTGDPNAALTAAQGSLYIRTDGSSASTRLYINTNGTTGWTSITTAT